MRFLRGVSGRRRTNRIGNQATKEREKKLHNRIENSRHVDVCFIKPKGKEATWKT